MAETTEFAQRVQDRLKICNETQGDYLDLSFCKLSEIPSEIKTFVWLKTLSLRVNSIKKISNLPPNLKTLIISNNTLNKICQGDIPDGVTDLRLEMNMITEIEEGALPLSLESIDLTSDCLESVKFLKPLVNLKRCDMPHNMIATLNESLPENLLYLNCADNEIEALPDDIPIGLEELIINYNNLTLVRNIPPFLRKLECYFNEITFIESLPSNMESLDISDNRLTELPILNDKLTTLDASKNLISVVSDVPRTLIELNLAKNEIQVVPTVPQGVKCDLSGNPCEKDIDTTDKRFPGTGNKLGTTPATPSEVRTYPSSNTSHYSTGGHGGGRGVHPDYARQQQTRYNGGGGGGGGSVSGFHHGGSSWNMSNHWKQHMSYDSYSSDNPHKIIMNGSTEV